MSWNRIIGILLSIALGTTMIAFAVTSHTEKHIEIKKQKIVQTKEVFNVEEKEYLEYVGIVESEKSVKMSFNQAGKIESVFVKKGDFIKKGQVLSKLDSDALVLANQGYQAQVSAAKASMNKALESLNYSKNNMIKMSQLFEAGIISTDEYDKAKLELQINQQNYNASLDGIDVVITNNEINRKYLRDTEIVSEFEGYVVDVLYEQGEVVAAGYPVIILRSSSKTLNIGLSQKDIQKIYTGMKTLVIIDDIEFEGSVIDIAQVPDSQTRTYEVEVSISDDAIPLGTVADVYFEIGIIKGMKVPINAILHFNSDYVYTVLDGEVLKKEIEVENLDGIYAYVSGLTDGDLVIIEGHKRVQENDSVKILN